MISTADKVRQHINSWYQDQSNYINDYVTNFLLAMRRNAEDIASASSSGPLTGYLIGRLQQVLGNFVPVQELQVLIEAAQARRAEDVAEALRAAENDAIKARDRARDSMRQVRDSELDKLDKAVAAIGKGDGKNCCPELEALAKDIQQRLGKPDRVPDVKDMQGDMLLDYARSRGWTITGDMWNALNASGYYQFTAGGWVIPGILDGGDIADYLNELGYGGAGIDWTNR